MSHSKERKEKDCLNCGAALTGRYCPVCGQENTEPKETVWGLLLHFFNDITHFDGKFFSTVKYLITKPGFLSAEYLKGRRASYLHPIRMYVFTSAFFFIIFFWLFNPGQLMKGPKDSKEQLEELKEASSSLKEKLVTAKDQDMKEAIQRSLAHTEAHVIVLETQVKEEQRVDSLKRSGGLAQKARKADASGSMKENNRASGDQQFIQIGPTELDFHSQPAYDSVQKELPATKRDSWFVRAMNHKAILYDRKFKNDRKEGIALFMEKFMHNLPQALFVSLPAFALLLMLLYSRRKFYYADHGIFAIHLYCAVFIILLIIFAFDKLRLAIGWEWLKIIKNLLALCVFIYLYKAMRRFYGQGRGKTIFKFMVLNILATFLFFTLAALFFFLSVMQFS